MGFFEPPNIDRMIINNDVKGLIKLLKHRDKRIRANAAMALGQMKDDRAVEPLIKAFEDNLMEESYVSNSIATAFISIKGWKEWERYLEMRKSSEGKSEKIKLEE